MSGTEKYCGNISESKSVEVTVAGDKISAILEIPFNSNLPFLVPVLVDLQNNGALGVDFHSFADGDTSGLDKAVRFMRTHGVGRIMPTFVTVAVEQTIKSAENLNKIISEDSTLEKMLGNFFHEGIFISPKDGWRGAHPAEYIRKPDYDLFKEIDNASGERFRMVNVAAEEEGGLAFIEKAVADGKVVSIGHAAPSSEIIAEAVKLGATMVTHFGNGAAATVKRFDNPFWSFLYQDELKLGLICDGFHLPPELVGTAIKCKGRENCWIVSDASPHSGCKPGNYSGGILGEFVIAEDCCIHLPEGREYFAGNWFQQDRCVEFLIEKLGIDFLEAWEMCSVIPARMMNIDLPEIKAGEEASFVLARYNEGLIIEQAVHFGKPYLDKPIRPSDTL